VEPGCDEDGLAKSGERRAKGEGQRSDNYCNMNYLLLSAVAFCAMAGALAAAPKKMDMFGAIVVGVVTALGGGTVRDAMLGTRAFWVADPVWVLVALGASVLTFAAGRVIHFRPGVMQVLDAFGLALFTVVGCEKALALDLSYSVVVLMGMVTGVAGGIVRDLLCDEIPMVLKRGELYATASFAGCIAFVGLLALGVTQPAAEIAGIVMTLVVRFAALRWRITLPLFKVKQPRQVTEHAAVENSTLDT
jgi:uncharacterized membrane protein YeiH